MSFSEGRVFPVRFRLSEEAAYREFLDIVSVVLCSDIEIGPNTFHAAARGHGVSEQGQTWKPL